MARLPRYRRVLVMAREGGAEAPAFRLAAELAHLLALDLEGLFVENEALLTLAGLPFARELRLPGHTWRALDAGQMLEDFRLAAEEARRMLEVAAGALGVPSAFSVLRGDPAGALAERAGARDILVMVESVAARLAGFRGTGGEIFWRDGAGVLLVPSRPWVRRGSVAVVLPGEEDGGLEIGAAIARAAAEDLVLVAPEEGSEARLEGVLREAGVPPARVQRRRLRSAEAGAIAEALRAAGARLAVLDRARLPEDAEGFVARLLAAAGVPVLVVGGAAPEGEAARGGTPRGNVPRGNVPRGGA